MMRRLGVGLGGGGGADLSLQFPGWPTVPVQRMMMLPTRESEAQKADLPGGQLKVPVLGLLKDGQRM